MIDSARWGAAGGVGCTYPIPRVRAAMRCRGTGARHFVSQTTLGYDPSSPPD